MTPSSMSGSNGGQPCSSRDWDPGLYMRFGDERTRPSIDLVSRINIENPQTIIDIGCGPGNSTRILRQRWPESRITGIDNSPAMIEKAKNDYPGHEWIIADAATFNPDEKYDIVFSNASIQWISNHEKLIAGLMELVGEQGALAIQIPLYRHMPISGLIERTASMGKWKLETRGCGELLTFHERGFYYDLLAKRCSSLTMWETSYIHVMNAHIDILEMIKSTGLKPYLEAMKIENDRRDFLKEVLREIELAYPAQGNGSVLFPFERLFFIAYR